MKRLSHIDEHSRTIAAPRECAWAALVAVGADLGASPPAPLARLWQLEPPRATGDWRGGPAAGAARPGFAVADVRAPERLALAGRHRFSRYSLVFELDAPGPDRTVIRARTDAAFPGALGGVYRALVIGSGAHRAIVAQLLRRIEARACSA
jgi:hypothetical protein